MSERPIQMKFAEKFTSGIRWIVELNTENGEEEYFNGHDENMINRMKEKLLSFLQRSPKEFVELIGNDNMEAIDNLLEDGHLDERLKFLEDKLVMMKEEYEGNPKRIARFINKAYREDGSRTLRWHILNENKPECILSPDDFDEVYGKSWEDLTECDTANDSFNSEKILTEDHNRTLYEYLLDEEAILAAIKSKSNLSATGCDALGNAIWKIGGKWSAVMIKHIIKSMLRTKRFPDILKSAKTVMLYKKGDSSSPRSWRPITIISTLYRLIMCHISRSLQLLNRAHSFIVENQKGFMKIPSGAAEHALSLNELVHDANRKNKSIIMVTIDFRDAFGSVPHDLINKTMKEIGFDKNFRKMIMDSYRNSSTRICVNGMIGKKYLFRRGVKQGCPLSPTLFNLCIEPLLRKLNKMEDDGYNWKKLVRMAQAYADDLVLVSKSVEGMKNLIRTVEEFCNFAGGIKVNASKCATLAYLWKDGRRVTIDENLMIQGEEIPTYSLHTAVNYLGLPVATNINAKKKHMFSKLAEMERDTVKVTDSALDFKYKIDAVEKFILPRIDYEMMAGIAPANALKKLDSLLRKKINDALNTAGLPREVFYMKINNGGLGLVKLWERENITDKIVCRIERFK